MMAFYIDLQPLSLIVSTVHHSPARATATSSLTLRQEEKKMDWSWDYWVFVRGKMLDAVPEYRPPPSRYQWVCRVLWIIVLNVQLAGCAAGALTCNDTTLRQGASCEVRPANSPSWGITKPKGMS